MHTLCYLYPRWVLCMGNDTFICISRQPLGHFAPLFCNYLELLQGLKTPNFTQFGALAGQIQHVAAQKVGFTPQPIEHGLPSWQL